MILDNVTVKVTIEVTRKTPGGWGANTIARSTIEDTSSCQLDEVSAKMAGVIEDAQVRAQKQLANTIRINELEQRNKLLAEQLKDNNS
jgi:hypothetical protein